MGEPVRNKLRYSEREEFTVILIPLIGTLFLIALLLYFLWSLFGRSSALCGKR